MAAEAAPAPAKPVRDMAKMGTHGSITCDGCAVSPIIGFRFKCTMCRNHDLCETCYESFENGELKHSNPRNTVSKELKDHAFQTYNDSDANFQRLASVKAVAVPKTSTRVKPNDPCPCNSGKKAKKCGCGAYNP
eukprot:a505_211.p1 GENE.a505_211~~a505_211.p1  ORF type:complete len:143 (-),score=41.92 a505_211:64-465(-)